MQNSGTSFGTRGIAVIGLGLLAGVAATAVQGCGEDGLCGPCGSILTGQVSVSGDAKLDGFFSAVADLGKATGTIKADFDANVRALAEIYGMVDANATIDAAFIADLRGRIRADFMANISGGIKLVYKPPQCSVDINVAVQAQASCEASADCDVEVDPGEASVSCEGRCEGSCDAMCMGEITCTTPEAGLSCDAGCEGSCELMGGATCEGTCKGMCNGNCSLTDAEGNCQGECDGECMGACELTAKAMCNGTCHGKCYATVMPPECMGEVGCSGTCMGQCSGSCEGTARPPSASADCDASAECEAQASAQAEANVKCTPPTLDWQFSFNAGVDADAQAAFVARVGELRARGAAIIQGFVRAKALIDGEVDGMVVFDPPPIANLVAKFNALVDAGVKGEFDIAPGRITCVIPAIQDSIMVLGDVTGEFGGSIVLQGQLVAQVLDPTAAG